MSTAVLTGNAPGHRCVYLDSKIRLKNGTNAKFDIKTLNQRDMPSHLVINETLSAQGLLGLQKPLAYSPRLRELEAVAPSFQSYRLTDVGAPSFDW